MQSYRILLADDHSLFRELIKQGLEGIPGLEVVGEVSDGLELLESLRTTESDMIILDIGMPNLSGIEAAQQIKLSYPQIKILLLTMYKSEDHLSHALDAGVDGYLIKEDAFKDLVAAINTVRGGKPYISDLVSKTVLDIVLQRTRAKSVESDILSAREIEILKYFAEGKSNGDIALLSSISASTVRNHISKIKKKLHITKNIDLVRYALKKGYASIS